MKINAGEMTILCYALSMAVAGGALLAIGRFLQKRYAPEQEGLYCLHRAFGELFTTRGFLAFLGIICQYLGTLVAGVAGLFLLLFFSVLLWG